MATTGYQFDTPPYHIWTVETGQPSAFTYYDTLGRAYTEQVEGFNGTYAYKYREFDNEGRVIVETLPYYDGDTVYYNQFSYDIIGRPIQAIDADNEITTYTYQGLTTTVTNPLYQTGTEIKNVVGWTVETRDADYNSMLFVSAVGTTAY